MNVLLVVALNSGLEKAALLSTWISYRNAPATDDHSIFGREGVEEPILGVLGFGAAGGVESNVKE
ncbi:MAG: hypothetical protein JETCAE01_31000 [Anaerolineaceae bacterium]|nr:MAG: hypothetical protein JETCAE01_31000 [Anaerolineaceae bacterium]